jgi:hypothetical protein
MFGDNPRGAAHFSRRNINTEDPRTTSHSEATLSTCIICMKLVLVDPTAVQYQKVGDLKAARARTAYQAPPGRLRASWTPRSPP